MGKQVPARALEVTQAGEVAVARFTVRTVLGQAPCQRVGDELSGLAGRGHRLVLNFTGVERLDSAVLGKLIGLHRGLKAAGGRLALCRLDPALAETFETLQLHRLLNLYDTEQQALDSFQ